MSPRWWSAVAVLCAIVAVGAPHESTQLAALCVGLTIVLRTLVDAD